ncbi:MAG: GyrI-like domain-containing protein, partial [Anaerolineae bacterium]|nr:GyrI-like domain-containing protein [Anaerolineae bacterium]
MKPEIVNREAFRVMGLVGHFPSAAANFGPLWNDTMPCSDLIELLRSGEGHYGVYLAADHAQPLDYLAGIPVREEDALPEAGPESLAVRELPAAMYAVFECLSKDIGPTYGFIWREWLKTSAYEQDTSKL